MVKWHYFGKKRPPFAHKPAKGQESVWDYPRPPLIEASDKCIIVKFGEKIVAESNETIAIKETASPPGFYIPKKDIDMHMLQQTSDRSFCEWKGMATYWILTHKPVMAVAWSYEDPNPEFNSIQGYLSFYPGRINCFVDGEKVLPQPGHFYGGWITKNIVGPFKGDPGTGHW
jgi:uncharacterized protein (DUF427 family)